MLLGASVFAIRSKNNYKVIIFGTKITMNLLTKFDSIQYFQSNLIPGNLAQKVAEIVTENPC